MKNLCSSWNLQNQEENNWKDSSCLVLKSLSESLQMLKALRIHKIKSQVRCWEKTCCPISEDVIVCRSSTEFRQINMMLIYLFFNHTVLWKVLFSGFITFHKVSWSQAPGYISEWCTIKTRLLFPPVMRGWTKNVLTLQNVPTSIFVSPHKDRRTRTHAYKHTDIHIL